MKGAVDLFYTYLTVPKVSVNCRIIQTMKYNGVSTTYINTCYKATKIIMPLSINLSIILMNNHEAITTAYIHLFLCLKFIAYLFSSSSSICKFILKKTHKQNRIVLNKIYIKILHHICFQCFSAK